MDQIGHWVRFADTKATILVAAVGVILTMLMTNGDTIVETVDLGRPESTVIYALSTIVTLSFLWTLFWLLRSISARRTTTGTGINRFAWPTLTNTDGLTLVKHGRDNDVREDAWQQVADLSRLAKRKFQAFNRALVGFGALIVASAALVGFAIVAGAEQVPEPEPSPVESTATPAAR
ncbi:hypothetical protein [Nocardioides rubriscoriae]|uniref:hypothetical protein n=1 Tax=Nocardioides rubriscoriae TaxID=642762 RepID=UPI0011DFBDD2|nr:hypothetical protein [Nocardioides rubriscoriae]